MWRWDTGKDSETTNDNKASGTSEDEDEGDVCGICRVAFEGCCPSCKVPGDDCPLSWVLSYCDFAYARFYIAFFLVWGECTHIFHMHCLLKWIGTSASKQQCPMDRRPWGGLCSCVAVDLALMFVSHQLRPKDGCPNALIRTKTLYDIHYPRPCFVPPTYNITTCKSTWDQKKDFIAYKVHS